jgi:hypothetical protein
LQVNLSFAGLLSGEDESEGLSEFTAGTVGDATAPVRGAQTLRRQKPPRPRMEEQMALSMPLTERLPQRYCIQNHLGVSVWYWAPSARPHATLEKHQLAAGQCQQLRCKPVVQQVVMEYPDGVQVTHSFNFVLWTTIIVEVGKG